MDDLDVLARDFGYRPQGKSAPMRSDASAAAADRRSSTVRSSTSSSSPLFNDVFGGPPKYTNPSSNNNFSNNKSSSMNDFDYDSIFKNNNNNNNNNSNNSKTSSLPVYDKPVYDDDIFEGLPGLKSKSVSSSTTNAMRFEDNVFASMASPTKQNRRVNDQFDDLLGNLGRNEKGTKEGKNMRSSSARGFDDLLGNLGRNEKVPEPKSSGRSSSSQGFDDLLGGFGSSSPASGRRKTPESHKPPKPTSAMDDPFVVLESTSTPASSSSGVFTDPLDEISNLGKSGSSKINASSVSGGAFDDLDPLNGFGRSVPPFSPEKGGREKEGSPSRMGPSISGTQTSTSREHSERSSFKYSEIHSQKKVPVDNFQEAPLFEMPSVSTDSKNSFSQNASSPRYANSLNAKNFQADRSPKSEEQAKSSDDIWLTVSEVPLFTQPTKAPPPSRPPPPIPRRTSKADSGFFSANVRKKGDEYSPSYSSYSESPKPGRPEGRSPPASQIDELEDFVMGRTGNSVNENANVHSSEEMDAAAAAMKVAMDRAEAKFRHAKEVREREHAKAAKSKESVQMEKDEHADTREREFRDNEVRLERERRQREKEEEEREQRRIERERERARQAQIERERARQAVERATKEARERAAADARERSVAEARARAERAAVEKAQAEARERAERSAVHRAQAEARERAAAGARERAEKAAAEAKERANGEDREKEAQGKAEARRRAERAAVEKAAAEARERAAAEARERAAAAARMNQQKNENDLESFFSTRPSSAPKARASSSDPVFDSQFQSKGGPDLAKRTSSTSVSSSNNRKTSSTANIVDDLSSIFGAAPSSGEFQEVEGETEERRRARLERHQRTQERAAKALAEKNQRDLQAQRDQEERNRIGETLDFEIKRWAAGKEGNLRALLSTLQYVLWPECGWQPVSLTDLITGASVKKVYRKATLCIHPDKVQQKGATLQQKYIAEKVFDLLKEAWNKFNSEELF